MSTPAWNRFVPKIGWVRQPNPETIGPLVGQNIWPECRPDPEEPPLWITPLIRADSASRSATACSYRSRFRSMSSRSSPWISISRSISASTACCWASSSATRAACSSSAVNRCWTRPSIFSMRSCRSPTSVSVNSRPSTSSASTVSTFSRNVTRSDNERRSSAPSRRSRYAPGPSLYAAAARSSRTPRCCRSSARALSSLAVHRASSRRATSSVVSTSASRAWASSSCAPSSWTFAASSWRPPRASRSSATTSWRSSSMRSSWLRLRSSSFSISSRRWPAAGTDGSRAARIESSATAILVRAMRGPLANGGGRLRGYREPVSGSRTSDLEEPAHRQEAGHRRDHHAHAEQDRDREQDLLGIHPARDEPDAAPQRVDEQELHSEDRQDREHAPQEALDHALDQERDPDEPVRGPDQLHDRYLLAAGEKHPTT